ncbi:diuretic hormone 41 isoform X3 [Helicoverpa armigera]|uniref:Diuretic 34 n=1 Tax=Helicoverpa armigera TaxID=29058 RepID=M4QFY8_HELAM|nr:diuretic hormone 41 isoform X3 [Helicoverpa armigera]AGH25555.1 diuretic 34 [Helicoverpa armigera]
MMWWALWCAVVVAGGAGVAAAPAPDSLSPLDMVQMDSSAPDDESLGYAMSPMAARYSAGAPWLYLLADVPRDSQVASSGAEMRTRRSFSVNPAVELLQRGAYNNYIERVRQDNRNFLDKVGKRGAWRNQN